jgi:glycosyltransferase involved in cell wall biosynthesis
VLATAAYVLRLARHLRRLDPDLVHANSLKAGVYGVLAGRLAGVPVIWHLRDRLAEDYLPKPAVWGVRRLMALAIGVVANSEATARTVGGRSVDLDVIRSVIPEVAERPHGAWAERSGPMTFGMVGRIAPWKGQDVFLRAFARAFADGDERAVIVGSAMFGETDFETSLAELARTLGLADRVELRGFREDVGRELADFDVLVHASITPEPFGQVVIEGMAAGLPVIASEGGGPSEIIEHGRTGMLHPGGDVDALARLMCALRDSPGLRARIAAAGYLRAGDYSPSAVAAQLTEVYRRALSRRRRGR